MFSLFRKRKYKVISASPVEQREVTSGFENRTFNGQKTVNIKGKLFQYTQQLIVKRKDEIKSIKICVQMKKKKVKVGKDKIIKMILKPKYRGHSIWM